MLRTEIPRSAVRRGREGKLSGSASRAGTVGLLGLALGVRVAQVPAAQEDLRA